MTDGDIDESLQDIASFSLDGGSEIVEWTWVTDGLQLGSVLLISIFLGIGPYIFLLIMPRGCLGLVFVKGYHYFLRVVDLYLMNDGVVPGISLFYWSLYMILSVIGVMAYTHLEQKQGEHLATIYGSFSTSMCVRLVIFFFTGVHAWNPSILSGITSFPQHRFAQLETYKRLKIFGLTVVVCVAGMCTHYFFLWLLRKFAEALGEHQIWWFVLMRVFRWLVKPVFWLIGNSINKLGANPAIDVAACYSVLLYSLYFVMYRQLLDKVKDVWYLMQAAALHASWEFFSFAVLFTPECYKCFHSMLHYFPFRLCVSSRHRNRDFVVAYQLAIRRRSVEYGNRMFLTFVTLIMCALQRTLLNFYYAKIGQDGPFDAEQLKAIEKTYFGAMQGIGVMCVFEVLAYMLIMWYNRHRVHGGSFRDPWLAFISENRHKWILAMSASHSFSGTAMPMMGDPTSC